MRFTILALLAAASLCAAPSLSQAAVAGSVRIDTGLVSGKASAAPSVTAFLGIPYAAPPTGDLRWRPPAPAKPWKGVRKADHYGDICPQTQIAQPVPPMSEDCLNLNVWTQGKAKGGAKAVMVWFHGAGPNQSGILPVYDGANLARHGVVVVTLNRRIGVLGNLATPDLSKESGHDASGDYGLMDDVAALKWVKRNITAFGGDPNNVTLFGQSFGAGTLHMLSLSPLAKGLFGRMILESHARYPKDPAMFEVATSYRTLKAAEDSGQKYVDGLGIHDLKTLRATPWQTLLAAPGGGGHVVDGYVVPHDYSDTYALGAQNNVFVIAGSNQDENSAGPESAYPALKAGVPNPINVPPSIVRLSDYIDHARKKFGPMADEFLELYPATTDKEAYLVSSAAVRDNERMSTWMWATAWTKAATHPVYLYFWTHAPPGKDHDLFGAYHGSEIPYAFDHLYPPTDPWADDDRKIAEVMSSYWANFAKAGNPNGPGLPAWPAFDGKTAQVMELGDHFRPIPLADAAKVDFWKRFYETQPAR